MAGRPYYQSLNFIYSEVYWLRRKWYAFRRLSVTGDNDDGVLLESADEFFGVVQRALKYDTVMTICRLFDKPRGTETLERALSGEKNNMRDSDFKRLKESLDKIELMVEAASLYDARHLVIAHSNQDVAHARESGPTSGIPAIEEIVVSITDWMIELYGSLRLECKFDESILHSSIDGLVKRIRGT